MSETTAREHVRQPLRMLGRQVQPRRCSCGELWPCAAVRAIDEAPAGGPLTCQFCRHAPGTHLLVADIGAARVLSLVCEDCGARNIEDARVIAKSRPSAWLFALTSAA